MEGSSTVFVVVTAQECGISGTNKLWIDSISYCYVKNQLFCLIRKQPTSDPGCRVNKLWRRDECNLMAFFLGFLFTERLQQKQSCWKYCRAKIEDTTCWFPPFVMFLVGWKWIWIATRQYYGYQTAQTSTEQQNGTLPACYEDFFGICFRWRTFAHLQVLLLCVMQCVKWMCVACTPCTLQSNPA